MALKIFDEVFEQAQALSDAGDDDGALAKYLEALELDFNNPVVHYNIGLDYNIPYPESGFAFGDVVLHDGGHGLQARRAGS